MCRLRVSVWVFLLGACLFACGGPEQALLGRFFAAIRAKDANTLSMMSAATYPWEVVSWEMVEVRSETTEPFALPELQREIEETLAASSEHEKQLNRFRREHYQDLETIRKRLEKDPAATLSGNLAEVRSGWEKLTQEREALQRQLGDLKTEQAWEQKLAKMSLTLASDSEAQAFDGEVMVKEVLVNVTISGEGEKPYLITLRKYNLTNRTENFSPRSRWIISDMEETRI